LYASVRNAVRVSISQNEQAIARHGHELVPTQAVRQIAADAVALRGLALRRLVERRDHEPPYLNQRGRPMQALEQVLDRIGVDAGAGDHPFGLSMCGELGRPDLGRLADLRRLAAVERADGATDDRRALTALA
jgi:hypothetical protein